MNPRDEAPSPYRWVVVGSLSSCVATSLSVLMILGLLLPDISEDLDLSPSQQGLLASSVLLANLFFSIPSNLWLSRYMPWRIASIGFLCVGMFLLVQGWSPGFAVLIIGRIGIGLGFMAAQAPRALLVQQWIPARQLAMTNGLIIGIIDLVMGAAYFITPVILAGVGGWRNTMYIWGGIALLVAVLWMILGRERATPAYQERLLSQERTPLAVMLKYPQLWVMGLGMAGAMLSFQAFSTFWPTFAGEELGVSLSTAGFVLGFMSIAAAPMDVLVNVVPSFVRRQTAVIGLSGLVTAGCLVGLLYISSTPLVILLGVVKGAAMAYFPVLMVMVYQLPGIKPREVAMGLAFMSTSIWVGSALGPLLVGFLEEATGDLQLSLLITAFFPLTLVVSALVLQGRRWQMVGQVPVSANPGHET